LEIVSCENVGIWLFSPLMNSAISIKQLSKSYKTAKRSYRLAAKPVPGREALKSIDLEIPQGSFFGLLGPNGAGKSTLINIIAGLTIKTSGKVSVLGRDLDRDPRGIRRIIGVVPQELVLDPFFSVWETLEYYAGYYGIPAKQRRTMEIIKALGLEDKINANSRRLSGGMKRRVLIAKALVHTPPVLILDEPTAGVDVDLRRQLWDYVRELNRSGATILLTTHYLEEAEELCDNIAIINHGRIIASEPKEHLLKTLNQKCLIIKLAEKIRELPESLKVYRAKIREGDIAIDYNPHETDAGALLGAVMAAGLIIRDVSTVEPNLEDIFRYLTRVA